jgi:uncharacterized protein (TIGR02452 family)
MGQLLFLPCVDSAELAAARRAELDIPQPTAAALGHSAVAAMRDGRYETRDGQVVDWRAAVEAARAARLSIPPEAPLPPLPRPAFAETRVGVSNETTLAAGRRLARIGLRPLALNFANGVNPGGGFLFGARAQEEVLCRSSALYATLDGDAMYAAHQQQGNHESSDWVILSPDVPVFRDDAGTPLAAPWLLSFATCAAPYAPSLGQPRSGDLLQARIARLLVVARAHGFESLVLGAWGCGAFANEPERTARDFRSALEGEFSGSFREAVFAVTDWSPERRFLGPFRDVLR